MGNTIFRTISICVLMLLITGCVPIMESDNSGSEIRRLENSFTISPQKTPPRNIQSVQLYRQSAVTSPPVINLDSDQTLVLEFDHLDTSVKQFKAVVRHYSRQWQESSLSLNYYLDGFYEDYFGGGSESYGQRPSYRHYEYEFPNDQLSMTVSGNYLLSIYDADTGELLFSLPFFISEDEGELHTRIKTEFVRRQDLREQDRPFSEYRYPDFVNLPQFDLSYSYVQNQFWGRARDVEHYDTSTPGIVNFHLAQEEAFLGDYEFNTLDIRTFGVDGAQILSYQAETTPPTLVLRRDLQNFGPVPSFSPGTRFGVPIDDRGGEYANVQFQFESATPPDSLQRIYLVGDFNGWSINEENRMTLDPQSGLWEGRALIKQGEYAYKYVTVTDNRIDELALDRSFTYRRQEYLTFIYYRDPVRHHDRLLKVDISNQ